MDEQKLIRNRCCFSGRLVKDAVITEYMQGKHCIDFSIAVQNDYKKNDQWVKETMFIDCSAFDDNTFKLAKHLKKGKLVTVYGRMKCQEYFSKRFSHTMKRYFLLIGALNLHFEITSEMQPENQNKVLKTNFDNLSSVFG